MSDIVSQTVEEICHCFLVFFVGSEAISEASGHLTRRGLCLGQVPTLGEDLLSVGVVRLIHHVDIIGMGWGDLGSPLCN